MFFMYVSNKSRQTFRKLSRFTKSDIVISQRFKFGYVFKPFYTVSNRNISGKFIDFTEGFLYWSYWFRGQSTHTCWLFCCPCGNWTRFHQRRLRDKYCPKDGSATRLPRAEFCRLYEKSSPAKSLRRRSNAAYALREDILDAQSLRNNLKK